MKLGLLVLTIALVITCTLTPKTHAFGWEKVDAVLKGGIADHTTPGLQALVADHTVRTWSLINKRHHSVHACTSPKKVAMYHQPF